MLNIVLFGGPGSGKGTQSAKLVEKYNLSHLSTGDILREAVKNQTEVGLKVKAIMERGELVSDEIVLEALEAKAITKLNTPGIIFDGFPRTIAQAGMLDAMLAKHGTQIDLIVAVDVKEDELTKRLLKRAEIEGRADDNEATIKNRIGIYNGQTFPLFELYLKQGKMAAVDGMGTVDEIFGRIVEAIDKHQCKDKSKGGCGCCCG